MVLEVRCAVLGTSGSWGAHLPENLKANTKGGRTHGFGVIFFFFKLKGPLEMIQLMGQYCPPRSMNCIHEEAVLRLLSSLLDGVQRVNPQEQPAPVAPAILWG